MWKGFEGLKVVICEDFLERESCEEGCFFGGSESFEGRFRLESACRKVSERVGVSESYGVGVGSGEVIGAWLEEISKEWLGVE